jgi:hypothetical protein
MMKQLYRHIAQWAGLFLLTALLTGCAKESSVVDSPEVKPTQPTQPAQTPIALSAYTAQQTAGTRADEGLLAEGGIPNGKSIGVYAYYHQGTDSNSDGTIDTNGAWTGDETPNFMFNQQATNNAAEDGFSYSPLKYWPNVTYDKLSFFGYYPYTTTFSGSSDPHGIVLTKGSNDEGLPAFELTVSDNVDDQVDFLISDLLTDLPNGTSAVSPSSATGRNNLTIVDKVRLLFHHATSKVTIRIAIDESIRQDFMSMTISNLELTNIYRKGTVTPSYTSGTTTIGVTGATDSLTYTIVDASVNPVVNHLTDTYLMLPQTLAYVEDDLAKTAKINLTYSITLRSHGTVYTYVDGNPVATDRYTYSNTASLPLAKLKRPSDDSEIDEWLPNHHYVYTIRLGAERIEFTGQVVKWGEEVPWDDIVVDQIGT